MDRGLTNYSLLAMLLVTLWSSNLLADASNTSQSSFNRLHKLEAGGHKTAALVWDIDNKKIIAGHNISKGLIPASITKLVTAASALETWGSRYRFSTRLSYQGQISKDGVLTGDLIFEGGGDPGLMSDDLWKLARIVSQSGLKSINGQLIVDASRFGQVACAPKDRCDALGYTRYSYDAQLSSAGHDYNVQEVFIPDARETGLEATLLPYRFSDQNLISSLDSGDRTSFSFERSSSDTTDSFFLKGKVKPDSGSRFAYVSVRAPAVRTGEAFRQALIDAGVEISKPTVVRYSPVEDTATTLLVDLPGQALSVQVSDLLHYSNNILADTLALNLLLEGVDNKPPLVLDDAGTLLTDYAREATDGSPLFKDIPLQAGEVILYDGSGLTPENRMSARSMVALLDRIYRQGSLFPAFYGGLTVPEFTSENNALNRPSSLWRERIAVKTGGLSTPVSVATVAGYARKKNGGWLAFTLMVNGAADKPLNRYDLFADFEKDLVNIIRTLDQQI